MLGLDNHVLSVVGENLDVAEMAAEGGNVVEEGVGYDDQPPGWGQMPTGLAEELLGNGEVGVEAGVEGGIGNNQVILAGNIREDI